MLRTSLIGALFAAASFTALAPDIERDAMDTSPRPAMERTVEEFGNLFTSAGIRLGRVVATKSPICVIEGSVE
jgi:hypothetical protein